MRPADPLSGPPWSLRRSAGAIAAGFAALVMLLPGTGQARDAAVLRDAKGRTVGTTERRPDGTVHLRDRLGRPAGTVTRGSGSELRLRDRYGRPAGSLALPSPRGPARERR